MQSIVYSTKYYQLISFKLILNGSQQSNVYYKITVYVCVEERKGQWHITCQIVRNFSGVGIQLSTSTALIPCTEHTHAHILQYLKRPHTHSLWCNWLNNASTFRHSYSTSLFTEHSQLCVPTICGLAGAFAGACMCVCVCLMWEYELVCARLLIRLRVN